MPQLLAAEIREYLSCARFSCCAVYLGEVFNRTQRVALLRCTGKSLYTDLVSADERPYPP
jgi:hypothetical protein